MQIDTTFETYDKFFNLNIDVKRKYTKKTGTTKNGWDELERERYTYFIIYLYGRKFFQIKPFKMRSLKRTDPGVRRSVVYLPGNKATLGNNELS